jgi:hypothetical protein
MEIDKSNEIKEAMANIYTQIAEREDKSTQISNITYYKELAFDSARFIENDVFVTKLNRENGKKGAEEVYEIYNKDGDLVATVDKAGKIHFSPEYIEKLRQEYQEYFEMLNLDNAVLELPEEIKERNITLQPEELEKEKKKEKQDEKGKEDEEKTEEEEEQEQEKLDPQEENQEQKAIAKKKGIPENNVLIVRDNSNFYKDHPEVERDLIFSRDKDGLVKAEYIDENGELQPSKYIMPSTTGIRQETVSIGSDGNPVTKESPQQVMQTRNLTGRDQDIRDVRINIKFDTYGYPYAEEARQGQNGKWAALAIEVKGRPTNSSQVNEITSIRTGVADPDRETGMYSSVEKTGLIQDGVQYDEMHFMQHSEEIIEKFIKDGYQRKEAVEIFNYMIGEEVLTENEAKERVNENIKEREKEQERDDDDEGRTPWGDAEARDSRR